MNPLARFESFVERLMERTLTRATHSQLQPVEIAKRLARIMDADQVVGALGVRVPNIFDVDLSPSDFDRFKPIRASVIAEIEAYLARVARDRLFVLASPPIVRLHSSPDLRTGEVGVHAQMEDIRPNPSPRGNGPIRSELPAAASGYTVPLQPVQANPAPAPRQHVSRLVGTDRSYRLEGSAASVGRAPENDMVVDDRRVSRRHAELVQTDGRWGIRDLESTNGTAVNGRLVREKVLHDGDRVSLGGFELIFQE